MENSAYKIFFIVFGSAQIMVAMMELISPLRAFLMWRLWVSNRFFPFHGIFLIMIGLPLAIYKGYLSSVIFAIGLLIVLMGPFVLIYPEKIRGVFIESEEIFGDKERKAMVYLDAFFRISVGIVVFISCWKTFYNY